MMAIDGMVRTDADDDEYREKILVILWVESQPLSELVWLDQDRQCR